MLAQAQLDQWEGTDEPLFVGPGLYAEIEKHIAETRPIVGYADGPDGPSTIPLQEEHEWEKEAVAPMICGREVYCTAWAQAPSQEERENSISLQDVLGTGPSVAGVEAHFEG